MPLLILPWRALRPKQSMTSTNKNRSGVSPGTLPGSAPGAQSKTTAAAQLQVLDRKQRELWRMALFLLLALATVFAWISWGTIRTLAHRFEALPIGLVVMVALFGAYAWKRTQEISELRGLMHGIEQRSASPPDEKQIDQLFELITRSQQGYRDLIDSFDDILVALSLDGEVRAANRSFSELVQAPFAQLIGHRLQEFLDDSTGVLRESVEKSLPHFLDKRQWAGVVRVRLKDASSARFFDCVLHAQVKEEKVLGVTVLARDITHQRESEARFTELFETLQEGIYFTTPEGVILDANPALVRMLGYGSKEELLRVNAVEFHMSPADRDNWRKEFDHQPVVYGREVTLKKKDGTKIRCLDTSTAVRDSAGRTIRYQGALLDVSHRRQMEQRLEQEQEFARRLVDSFPDPIFVIDTERNYRFISPRVEQALGFTVDEMSRMQIGMLTHPEDRPAQMRSFQELIAGEQSFASLEHRVQNRSGEWRRFRTNATPLFDPQRKIIGVVASLRDITDLKRLEDQLIQSEKLAAMGQMIAGVAHELNNPLTAILGVIELVRDRSSDESAKKQLDLAHRQARRAAQIVQNLLDFSRPPAPQKKLVQVNDLLERTLQLHEHSLRRNHISVEFTPQPDLPWILGDANQLIQVLLNLVTNAEHAIKEVRDSGKILIQLTGNSQQIAIRVQDDGAGIRKEALPKLFDPFYTTKRPGGGTGLGLSICMSIVREHSGQIEVERIPDGGSAFTIVFPVAPEQASDKQSHPEQTNAAASPIALPQHSGKAAGEAASLKDRTVLVVDDEEGILELVKAGLEERGLKIDCAVNAAQALSLAAHNSYDAVLCDVNLKGPGQTLSGEELYERLCVERDGIRPPFIFMTGAFVESSPSELRDKNPRRVQKPFLISDIVALLKEVFEAVPAESIKK
jgi:PAS domain S-box-containing protein